MQEASIIHKELQANKGTLREGEIVFSMEEQTDWLTNKKWSAPKIHTSNIIQTEKFLFIFCKYIDTHICI